MLQLLPRQLCWRWSCRVRRRLKYEKYFLFNQKIIRLVHNVKLKDSRSKNEKIILFNTKIYSSCFSGTWISTIFKSARTSAHSIWLILNWLIWLIWFVRQLLSNLKIPQHTWEQKKRIVAAEIEDLEDYRAPLKDGWVRYCASAYPGCSKRPAQAAPMTRQG